MKLLNLARCASFTVLICFFSIATTSTAQAQVKTPVDKQAEKVYKPAQYPGGEKAMLAFLAKTIKYPEGAKQVNSQGTIKVGCTVEADGSLSNIRHIGDPEMDNRLIAEALRVVALMPKWKPAQGKKSAIASPIEIPVKFAL